MKISGQLLIDESPATLAALIARLATVIEGQCKQLEGLTEEEARERAKQILTEQWVLVTGQGTSGYPLRGEG